MLALEKEYAAARGRASDVSKVTEEYAGRFLGLVEQHPADPASAEALANVAAWPTVYVLDAKGVIRYKDVEGKELDDAVETLLKEVMPAKP